MEEKRALWAELDRQAELGRRQAAEEERKKQAELAAEKERERARLVAELEARRKTHGFASIIGQRAAIQRLVEFAVLYSGAGKPPAHILLTGIDGIGKRTLARAFAIECCNKSIETDARALGHSGDLFGIFNNLGEYDALLVADMPRIPKILVGPFGDGLREFVFDVNKGMFAKRVTLKRFTCIATAPSKAECPPQLIEAFPLILCLQGYSQTDLASICWQLVHRKGIAITPGAAILVAGASAGCPHHIEVLLDRLVGLGRTTISEEDVSQVLSVLGLGAGSVSSASPGQIEILSGVDFEKVIAALLRAMGFHTEMTEVSGDGGVDIVATLDQPLVGGRYLIQCKRFAPGKLVGAATVRDFYGTLTADRRAAKGILVTTSGFTAQAVAFAANLRIELIDGHKLRDLLGRHGISTEIQPLPGKRDRPLFD